MGSGPLAQLARPLKKLHVHFPVLCIGVYGLTHVPSPYTWGFSFFVFSFWHSFSDSIFSFHFLDFPFRPPVYKYPFFSLTCAYFPFLAVFLCLAF